MSYKVIEQNGNWSVVQDSYSLSISGGTELTYTLYNELFDKPHLAEKHFERNHLGKLVGKPKRDNSTSSSRNSLLD